MERDSDVSQINDRGCSWERGRLRPVPDMMNPESNNLKPARSDLHTEMEKPSREISYTPKPNLQLSLILLSLHVPPDVEPIPKTAPAGAPVV